jgi:CHAD domain-containing protein
VPDPSRVAIISMCERALAGEISLDEFWETWPEPTKDPALAPAREALEEGITHTPSRLLRRGVDHKAWRASPEYADLEAQLHRLREQA